VEGGMWVWVVAAVSLSLLFVVALCRCSLSLLFVVAFCRCYAGGAVFFYHLHFLVVAMLVVPYVSSRLFSLQKAKSYAKSKKLCKKLCKKQKAMQKAMLGVLYVA